MSEEIKVFLYYDGRDSAVQTTIRVLVPAQMSTAANASN